MRNSIKQCHRLHHVQIVCFSFDFFIKLPGIKRQLAHNTTTFCFLNEYAY